MNRKFVKPPSLRDAVTHYCSGCGHGILHRLVAETIDELELREKTIGVAPVGCAVIAYDYWDFDVCEAAHGRALAVATGIKRCRPESVVFTYQGDGDLVSIGMAETFHTANRGENLTCIFVNNACYGMTGGQMAPTTLIGQMTATTPQGRSPKAGEGWPIKFSEILASLEGVNFAARAAVSSPKEIIKARSYIKKAFSNQLENKGFSIVEVLSPCPTVWQKKPYEAMKWIDEEMVKTFPLGVIKDK
ncbi:MAG: thiamine pyrophosphate-dependent enzyme [Candidatus Omnitrophica bacterium]|jgi:2-oxoglutarate ferredoxin oxidoreductase subunit beta|nr:thiamine pyrophosphate-dependent enzyme [Candidatus Omnitrophota bacterium]